VIEEILGAIGSVLARVRWAIGFVAGRGHIQGVIYYTVGIVVALFKWDVN